MTDTTTRPATLLSPLTVGSKTLRNRVMVPAHEPRLAEGGVPSTLYVDYHRARARGGAGIQVTGQLYVSQNVSAEAGLGRFVITDEGVVPGLRDLSRSVRAEGGAIVAQLGHPGALALAKGAEVVGAHSIYSDINGQWSRPLSAAELAAIRDDYCAAASRAMRGEMDGIEISMHTGNLLSGFLSPMNQRDDEWGGSLENRLRFPLSIVRRLREVVGPNPIVGVKLTADDYLELGLQQAEGVEIAYRLVETGCVDYLSITVGTGIRMSSQRRERRPLGMCQPHGEFRALTRAIKDRTGGRVPVCYIGGITEMSLAEEIVTSGDADFVGMVRAHIADPDIVVKYAAGRAEDIRPCVHVNDCINLVSGSRQSIQCIGNPHLGREERWRAVPHDALAGSRILVVGGGPCGLEAARAAAAHGAIVDLHEAGTQLGGQLHQWSAAENLREARRLIHWWERQLKNSDVTVHYLSPVKAEDLMRAEADHVVIATGSVPAQRVANGLDELDVPVIDSWAALKGPQARHVVIVDHVGGAEAIMVAERLCESSDKVSLVTSRFHVAFGEGLGSLYAFVERLQQLEVDVYERSHLVGTSAGAIQVRSSLGAAHTLLSDVDLVVNLAGRSSYNPLAGELSAGGIAHAVVGDAAAPRNVNRAVNDASDLVLKLAEQQLTR